MAAISLLRSRRFARSATGHALELDKALGESVIGTWGMLEEPIWKWPDR